MRKLKKDPLSPIDEAIKDMKRPYDYAETKIYLDKVSAQSQEHLAKTRDKLEAQEGGNLSPLMKSLQSVVSDLKGPFNYKESADRLDEISRITQEQLENRKKATLDDIEEAAADPMFLDDLAESMKDFEKIDQEELKKPSK